MSNHHWKQKPPQTNRRLPPWTALLITIVGLGALLLLIDFGPRRKVPANWVTSSVKILDTRITVQRIIEADQAHPAEIHYQAEVYVTYPAEGKQYTQWIPANGTITADRQWLVFLLSRRKDNMADVKWNPANPTQAIATLRLQ